MSCCAWWLVGLWEQMYVIGYLNKSQHGSRSTWFPFISLISKENPQNPIHILQLEPIITIHHCWIGYTNYCWVNRGRIEGEVCLTLQHVIRNGNATKTVWFEMQCLIPLMLLVNVQNVKPNHFSLPNKICLNQMHKCMVEDVSSLTLYSISHLHFCSATAMQKLTCETLPVY